jgi:hypothetical protein
MPSLELPLVLVAILAGTLAVTSASRGAWVAIALLAATSSALEFSVSDPNHTGLVLRISAIGIGLIAALPEGLFEPEALRRDLALRTIFTTLREHPVVVASAAAGLLLGLVPLALPIESSSGALRAAARRLCSTRFLRALSCPPTSHTVNEMFLYSTVSTLKPARVAPA